MNKVVRNNIYQSDVRLVTHKQYKKKWRNIINTDYGHKYYL